MGADAEPLSVSLMDLISKRIRIIGSQQNGPEYLYEALDFVAKGKVKTVVETYPLAEAPKAYDRVAEGKARFRALRAFPRRAVRRRERAQKHSKDWRRHSQQTPCSFGVCKLWL